jgi:hypothetical protein
MTRKDSEKDAERPHYYSQFWLDVAAGRRIIGAPKGEEGEIMEPDLNESDVPVRTLTSARATQDDYGNNAQDNGYAETVAHPVVTPDDVVEPLDVEMEPNELGDLDIQNDEMEDANIPDMDLGPIDEDEVEQEEDFFDEEEEEEEEEDDGWNARGRKKPSPKRPTKQPPAKKPKREPRRGF